MTTPNTEQWQEEARQLASALTHWSKPTPYTLQRAAALLTELAEGKWTRVENEHVAIDVAKGLQLENAKLREALQQAANCLAENDPKLADQTLRQALRTKEDKT